MDIQRVTEKLKEYFGHEGFRAGQERLVDAVLSGRDCLGIMPTGGGKSVCYQLPAMLLGGSTIVISPLISLMKDQIDSLKENGISAAYINSTLSDRQIELVLERARAGEYKIIYVAPERLLSPRFVEFCASASIPLVAIDEAHCVSQWGQDFRPSYAAIPDFIAKLKTRPTVAAFTATATERVRQDVVSILSLNAPLIEVSGFDRENLFFEVRHKPKRYDELVKIVKEHDGQFGIVYCATRKTVETVCDKLKADGFNAARYHAGLSDNERHKSQDDFIYDKVNIIVATNAFGMGIDKSNVSFVVHFNMPKDLESYYQEAGRAGRDGMPADCILLYSGQDLRTNLFLIEHAEGRQYESEAQKDFLQEQERKRLKEVDLYCNTNSCLRNYILKYFGEHPAGDCENCGNCHKETDELDITLTAQKVLSCVARTKGAYGKNMIIDVLRGSKNAKILRAGLNEISTYGICSEPDAELKEIVNYLIEHGYLAMTNGEYPLMRLGSRADEILRDRTQILMPHARDLGERETAKSRRGKEAKGVTHLELYARLKTLRREIADEQGVPPFVIFHDKTLAEMSNHLPGDKSAFLSISGVGNRKTEAYGSAFLDVINRYCDENNLPASMGSIQTENEKCDIDISILTASDQPMQIGEIAKRINAQIEPQGIKKLSAVVINDWLTEKGLLCKEGNGSGKSCRKATLLGLQSGITQQQRTGFHGTYTALFYPKELQEKILASIQEILAFRKSAKGTAR